MDPGTSAPDFVEEFASAAEWFASHLARTSARAPVPACGGWAVVDLTAHLGNVHSWAATITETGQPAEQLDDRPSSTRARRMSEWYLGKAEDLYAVLRATDPDRPTWNFAFEHGTAAFWARRQAHETLMHGIDLAQAGDHAERMPLRMAVDGVAEVLEVFLWRMHQRGHPAVLHRPIELRALEVDLAWVVEPSGPVGIPAQAPPGERAAASGATSRAVPRVTRVPGVGPADGGHDRVEAPAAELLKLLWKRATPDGEGIRLVGDEDRILGFLGSRLTA